MNAQSGVPGKKKTFLLRTLLFFALGISSFGAFSANAEAASIPLALKETAGIVRAGEMVRSGIPLPKSLNIRDTKNLRILDVTGKAIPAEFRILARWNAGLENIGAPIQWVLAVFPANVSADTSGKYTLKTDAGGAAPALQTPLKLTNTGTQVTVDTGAGIFSFGGNTGALFDEIKRADGVVLVKGSSMTGRANGSDVTHSAIRSVRIEHQGPLSAVVIVEGEYNMPLLGGALSSSRRYTFAAGSPMVIVRQAVNWEGSRGCTSWICRPKDKPEVLNSILVERVRNLLDLNISQPYTVSVISESNKSGITASVQNTQEISLRQRLRANRTDPLKYEVNFAGKIESGMQADGGMVTVSGANGGIAVALNQMHRYEPQALRVLPGGRIAIDMVDDKAWLEHHQGLFATFAVSVLSPATPRDALNSKVWAPLNKPLHAWPTPEWFVASGAVEEFPLGTLPAEYAKYDTLMASIMKKTLDGIDIWGLSGLMTFGVYPRYWGNNDIELKCKDGKGDPTPNEHWDDLYWCGTWTDYHNTLSLVPIWAMRTGQTELLDELAIPGALRTLHTQIMQCGPNDKWFYCGQSPAGYGGYRKDFNSHHGYFENIYLYYWLTGDSMVVKTLQRGAQTMRINQCSKRPGAACGPHDFAQKNGNEIHGRGVSQWTSTYRFVGLAGDSSYLEDYKSNLSRMATMNYVEVLKNSIPYGFIGTYAPQAGTNVTRTLWSTTLYDIGTLYRFLRDTGDMEIGDPALKPSRIITGWARTVRDHVRFLAGSGTVDAKWPSLVSYTWSGSRIGGILNSVAIAGSASQPVNLYPHGKTNLAFPVVIAAEQTGEESLLSLGRNLVLWGLAKTPSQPLNKETGIYLFRFHTALAQLVNDGGELNSEDEPVMITDVILLLQAMKGEATLSAEQLARFDTDQDGKITLIDVIQALRKLLGEE